MLTKAQLKLLEPPQQLPLFTQGAMASFYNPPPVGLGDYSVNPDGILGDPAWGLDFEEGTASDDLSGDLDRRAVGGNVAYGFAEGLKAEIPGPHHEGKPRHMGCAVAAMARRGARRIGH